MLQASRRKNQFYRRCHKRSRNGSLFSSVDTQTMALSKTDVAQLRLINKRFANVGEPLLLETCIERLRDGSFDAY